MHCPHFECLHLGTAVFSWVSDMQSNARWSAFLISRLEHMNFCTKFLLVTFLFAGTKHLMEQLKGGRIYSSPSPW